MTSALLGSRWRFPAQELVEAERPYHSEVSRTEREWAPLRADPDTKHWNWIEIVIAHGEHFGVRCDDVMIALWAANEPVHLTNGEWYPLEYVEVSPARRGQAIWGQFILALVCVRARELGADGVTLLSFERGADWYRRLGARDGAPGWKGTTDLVPLHLDRAAMLRLAELADGFREEEGAA